MIKSIIIIIIKLLFIYFGIFALMSLPWTWKLGLILSASSAMLWFHVGFWPTPICLLCSVTQNCHLMHYYGPMSNFRFQWAVSPVLQMWPTPNSHLFFKRCKQWAMMIYDIPSHHSGIGKLLTSTPFRDPPLLLDLKVYTV